MLLMDMIAEIRRRHLISQESISSIARDLKLSRPTVRKHCRTRSEPVYHRSKQPTPMLGAFENTLDAWLRTERLLPKRQRRTARRLFEGLQAEGYRGAYDSVQRYVQRWKAAKSGPALTGAFVPLAFAPGEVCQFDWSHEHVELGGVMATAIDCKVVAPAFCACRMNGSPSSIWRTCTQMDPGLHQVLCKQAPLGQHSKRRQGRSKPDHQVRRKQAPLDRHSRHLRDHRSKDRRVQHKPDPLDRHNRCRRNWSVRR